MQKRMGSTQGISRIMSRHIEEHKNLDTIMIYRSKHNATHLGIQMFKGIPEKLTNPEIHSRITVLPG